MALSENCLSIVYSCSVCMSATLCVIFLSTVKIEAYQHTVILGECRHRCDDDIKMDLGSMV